MAVLVVMAVVMMGLGVVMGRLLLLLLRVLRLRGHLPGSRLHLDLPGGQHHLLRLRLLLLKLLLLPLLRPWKGSARRAFPPISLLLHGLLLHGLLLHGLRLRLL